MSKVTKYIKISDLAKILNLRSAKNYKLQNYTLRFWEREFRQIKPKMINNQRYYSPDQIELVKLIHFLLKKKGMTINGAKSILNSQINKLDDYNSNGLKAQYYKKFLKERSVTLLKKVNNLKKYGKKNTFKS